MNHYEVQQLSWSAFGLCMLIIIRSIDFTAATILERFQNEAASAALERVLKKVAQQEAQETLKVRMAYLRLCSSLKLLVDSGDASSFLHLYLCLPRGFPAE